MNIGDAWRSSIWGTKSSQKFQSHESQNRHIDIIRDVICDQEFPPT